VVRAVIVAAASLCIGTAALQAQAPDWRTVQGRVVRPAPFLQGDSTAVVTVSDQVVVLHRVAPSVAGPLDSVRTDRDGRYRFRYQPSGGPEAIYFVSATYGGIAYFTNPLRSRDVGGAEAEIAVFDTTTRAFPLTVRGRHLIVGALDSTRERTIVEIFEISNDSTRTIVAADGPDAEPTWSFAIPEGAREVKAGQGDLPADAFVQAAGRVSLYAALAPGLKQLSVSYKLPESAFPLELLLEQGAVALEVLMEEPTTAVSGANLVIAEPVALEGRQFQRALSQDARPGERITVTVAGGGLTGRGLYITVLLGAIILLMLVALLRAGMRRQRPIGASPKRQTPAVATADALPTAERLAREIADLDAAFVAISAPSEDIRRAYERRRAELATLLREELARSTPTV
jgi:hypothetical protein